MVEVALSYHHCVAVCIGSDLSKDMAGKPLWTGVSFKVERRERFTVAAHQEFYLQVAVDTAYFCTYA